MKDLAAPAFSSSSLAFSVSFMVLSNSAEAASLAAVSRALTFGSGEGDGGAAAVVAKINWALSRHLRRATAWS